LPSHRDLFLATAGPGELSTVRALMGEAIKAGADCLLITGLHNAPLAKLADTVLVLPTTTMANDRAAQPVLPMGSTFEGALFLMFELMVLDLRERLGETPHGMRARHTNME
jgi:6-phospho-3-hexuloisomerase